MWCGRDRHKGQNCPHQAKSDSANSDSNSSSFSSQCSPSDKARPKAKPKPRPKSAQPVRKVQAEQITQAQPSVDTKPVDVLEES